VGAETATAIAPLLSACDRVRDRFFIKWVHPSFVALTLIPFPSLGEGLWQRFSPAPNWGYYVHVSPESPSPKHDGQAGNPTRLSGSPVLGAGVGG